MARLRRAYGGQFSFRFGKKTGARSGDRTRMTFRSGDFKSPASSIPPSGRRDDNGRVFEGGAEMRANFALRYLNPMSSYGHLLTRRSRRTEWRPQSGIAAIKPGLDLQKATKGTKSQGKKLRLFVSFVTFCERPERIGPVGLILRRPGNESCGAEAGAAKLPRS